MKPFSSRSGRFCRHSAHRRALTLTRSAVLNAKQPIDLAVTVPSRRNTTSTERLSGLYVPLTTANRKLPTSAHRPMARRGRRKSHVTIKGEPEDVTQNDLGGTRRRVTKYTLQVDTRRV